MNPAINQLKFKLRIVLGFFMVALCLSGATAIPVEEQLTLALPHLDTSTGIGSLLQRVLSAVQYTKQHYPFLLYGYDWLAFAHFVIAVAFIGPFKEPVRNIWVLQFGMIACAMVLPFALVFSTLRGLPLWWCAIDCSFGVIGALPLWYCYRKARQLENLLRYDFQNIIF